MAIITLPSCPPIVGINWSYKQPTQVNRSEWTGERRVTILPFATQYTADVQQFEIVDEASFWAWNAFIGDLQGQANKFRLPVVRRAQISGVSPLVNGASQTGTALVTDGWGSSGTKLKRGQWVTISDQLMRLTADVVSASGVATLNFDRRMRVSPADNTALVVDSPTALVALTDDTVQWGDNSTQWDATGEGSWTLGFQVEEAL